MHHKCDPSSVVDRKIHSVTLGEFHYRWIEFSDAKTDSTIYCIKTDTTFKNPLRIGTARSFKMFLGIAVEDFSACSTIREKPSLFRRIFK